MSVTVEIDVPQPRADVYAFLDVMANHEQFTDHMLTEWKVSGPATGIGSKAHVTSTVGGRKDGIDIEVIEVVPDVLIKERNVAGKGRRVGTGTYRLSDLPDGGTRVEFEYAFERIPAVEKPFKPLMTSLLRKGNARALARLKESLAAA
jgi:hypothetical protein